MAKGLNARMQRFVDAYSANGGNGTEAARTAGYKGDDQACAVHASKLLRIPKVIEALKALGKDEANSAIATRKDRREFWTKVMLDVGESMRDRLKASELLGKSKADFIDRVKHSVDSSFADVLKAARERAQRGE